MTTALSYELFIFKLKAFGKYQKTRAFALQLVVITIPLCSLTSIFSLQSVDQRCYIEARHSDEQLKALSESYWQKIAYPPKAVNSDSVSDLSCSMYDPSIYENSTYLVTGIETSSGFGERPIVRCQEFEVSASSDGKHSATEEFEIFCDKEAFRQTGTALLFCGKAIGLAMGGQIADLFGRKPLLILLQVALIAGTGITAFVPSLSYFLVGRFFIGFSYATNYLLVFAVVCEMLLPPQIVLLGFMMEASFGVGMAILALLAYFFRYWRTLQIVVALAGIPSVLICIWSPESLRWLISSGKFQKARELAMKMAKTNGIEFDSALEDELSRLCESANAKSQKNIPISGRVDSCTIADDVDREISSPRNQEKPSFCGSNVSLPPAQLLPRGDVVTLSNGESFIAQDSNQKQSRDTSSFLLILRIFRTPKLRTRVLVLAFCWGVISAVYYGISLGGSMIPGSIYLNTAIGGLLEVPAMIVAYFVATKFGRKWILVCSLMLTGLSCASITLTTTYGTKMGSQILAQIGKFGISICYGVIYIYTLELIPTCVRTTGMSFCSITARIGSILTPYASLLSDMFWEPLGFLLYGGLALVAGLSAISLPETLNKPLQDSCEDAVRYTADIQKVPHPGIVHIEPVTPVNTNMEGMPVALKDSCTSLASRENKETCEYVSTI